MSNRAIDNVIETDGALILGAGIAGLFTALKLAPFPALMLAGSRPGASGSSAWAQGGIAAAVGEGDSWQSHAADTITAGAGLCDPEIVGLVAREDRGEDGSLALGREAAHSRARIVHVTGDRAGAEISRTLAARALAAPSIRILEGYHAVELAMEDGRAVGLFARHGTGTDARLVLFKAKAVIFATGGLGALYAVTTNPLEARGEGLGMAARAGALIADPEFIQFHPTAIAIGRDPAPLATEALRGFMPAVHADAELAPRDVVARAIHRQIVSGCRVFLDCREAIGATFAAHFPTVYAACQSAGIDPVRQPIPVAPAAHYHMGGIASDGHGRSSIPGLWVAGECAATGLHGANRLASNSLLEALVFGARVADNVKGAVIAGTAKGEPPAPKAFALPSPPHVLRAAMSRHMGLERNAEGLGQAMATIARLEQTSGGEPALLNMLAAARLATAAALSRQESRGGHWRSDFPATRKDGQRSFMTLADVARVDAPALRRAAP
jgi:L-aspartate oxidase